MSSIKRFVSEAKQKLAITEFLKEKFGRSGFGGVEITRTPLGTHVVIYTMRPGRVIGRRGQTIKELSEILEKEFGLPNPQITVVEVEVPELNPYIMASRIAASLERGVHFRRASFWALRRIMEAGALGAEIVISGKLRSDRSRYEKCVAGYVPKAGEPAEKYVKKAVVHVKLKPGVYGVKVSITQPDAVFPDKPLLEVPKAEETTEETE